MKEIDSSITQYNNSILRKGLSAYKGVICIVLGKVGSIILSATKKDDANVANILEVGEEVKNPLLKVGAKVIFKEYSTTSYKDNDEEYLLIKDEDILAVIE